MQNILQVILQPHEGAASWQPCRGLSDGRAVRRQSNIAMLALHHGGTALLELVWVAVPSGASRQTICPSPLCLLGLVWVGVFLQGLQGFLWVQYPVADAARSSVALALSAHCLCPA